MQPGRAQEGRYEPYHKMHVRDELGVRGNCVHASAHSQIPHLGRVVPTTGAEKPSVIAKVARKDLSCVSFQSHQRAARSQVPQAPDPAQIARPHQRAVRMDGQAVDSRGVAWLRQYELLSVDVPQPNCGVEGAASEKPPRGVEGKASAARSVPEKRREGRESRALGFRSER